MARRPSQKAEPSSHSLFRGRSSAVFGGGARRSVDGSHVAPSAGDSHVLEGESPDLPGGARAGLADADRAAHCARPTHHGDDMLDPRQVQRGRGQ